MSADSSHSCPSCKKPVRMEGRKPGERVICPGCYRTAIVAQVEGPNGAHFRLVPNEPAKKPAPPLPPTLPKSPVPGAKSAPANVAAHSAAPLAIGARAVSSHVPEPPVAPNQPRAASTSRAFDLKNDLVPLLRKNRTPIVAAVSCLAGVLFLFVVIRAFSPKSEPGSLALEEAPKAVDGETTTVADHGTKPVVEKATKPLVAKGRPEKASGARPAAVPGAPPTGSPALSDEELVSKCDKSVCLIETPTATGTGFIVGPKLIATNEHVIGLSDLKDVKLTFPSQHNSTFDKLQLAFAVWKTDLILIYVPDLPPEYPALPVAHMSDLAKFETLTVLGFPLGLNRESMATPVKYGSKQVINEAEMLTLTGGAINHGNSGGPAINKRGYVAGVVTLKNRGEGIGHAIPCDTLAGALNDMKSLPRSDLDHRVADWQAKQVANKLFEGCRLCRILLVKEPFNGLSLDKKAQLLKLFDQGFGVEVSARLQYLQRTNIDALDRDTLEKMAANYQELSEQTRRRSPSVERVNEVIEQLPNLVDRFTKRLGRMHDTAEEFLSIYVE